MCPSLVATPHVCRTVPPSLISATATSGGLSTLLLSPHPLHKGMRFNKAFGLRDTSHHINASIQALFCRYTHTLTTAHSAAATCRICTKQRIARPSTSTHNGFSSDDLTAIPKLLPAAMITIATPGVGEVAPPNPLYPQHTACPSPPLIPQLWL